MMCSREKKFSEQCEREKKAKISRSQFLAEVTIKTWSLNPSHKLHFSEPRTQCKKFSCNRAVLMNVKSRAQAFYGFMEMLIDHISSRGFAFWMFQKLQTWIKIFLFQGFNWLIFGQSHSDSAIAINLLGWKIQSSRFIKPYCQVWSLTSGINFSSDRWGERSNQHETHVARRKRYSLHMKHYECTFREPVINTLIISVASPLSTNINLLIYISLGKVTHLKVKKSNQRRWNHADFEAI